MGIMGLCQIYVLLRSAVGMAHVLQSGLVMGYTTLYFPLIVLGYHLDYTQKLTRSTSALKLSVSPTFYPWVTATCPVSNKWFNYKKELHG